MKSSIKVTVGNKKNCKTYAEIRKRIKEFFEVKGETLTKDELERTVKAYIYLTDDRIPVNAVVIEKGSK